MKPFAEIAFTPAVQALQGAHGPHAAYARARAERAPGEGLGAHESEILTRADSFYLAPRRSARVRQGLVSDTHRLR
jgi:hypothetical protein